MQKQKEVIYLGQRDELMRILAGVKRKSQTGLKVLPVLKCFAYVLLTAELELNTKCFKTRKIAWFMMVVELIFWPSYNDM